MPPDTPSSTRAMARMMPTKELGYLRRVVVRQHALCDFLEGHGQVVLRARLHQRRRIVVEGAFAELVVVVVDLPGALRGHDDERIARIHVVQQVVDSWMDHGRDMVPAGANSPRTSSTSSSTAGS